MQPSYFLSDLDGTLIMGDTCNGSQHFPGLVQAMFENGVLPYRYDIPSNYKEWKTKYYSLLDQFDTTVCTYPLRLYSGSEHQDAFIRQYWDNVISKHFVQFTHDYLQQQSENHKIWIVSGSPTCFIQPVMNHLPFVENIIGIENDDIITYGHGKLLKIRNMLDLDHVAGYIGDVWVNDGPIMSHLRIMDQEKDLIFIEHGQLTPIDRMHLNLYNILIVHGF